MNLEHLGVQRSNQGIMSHVKGSQRLDNLRIKKIGLFLTSSFGRMEQMSFSLFLPLSTAKTLGYRI